MPNVALGDKDPDPGPWWLLLLGALLMVELLGAGLLFDQQTRDTRGWTRAAMATKLDAMAQCQAFASRYVVERTPSTRARFVRPYRQPDDVVEQRVNDQGGGSFVVRDSVTLATPTGEGEQEYTCAVRHRGGSVWRVETFALSGE